MTLLQGEHDLNNVDCWCHPEIMTTCGECCDATGKANADCWKCGGRGLVQVDPIEIVLTQHSMHEPWTIVHRQGWKRQADGDEGAEA